MTEILAFSIIGRCAIAVLVLVGSLAGCVQTSYFMPDSQDSSSSSGGAATTENKQFSDIPMPSGVSINANKTLVFGADPWFGKLTLDTLRGQNAMFDFYRKNLPKYQWEEVTFVRSQTSILTSTQANRVISISIRKGTLLGAEITITISPRSMPGEEKPNKDKYVPATKVLPAPTRRQ